MAYPGLGTTPFLPSKQYVPGCHLESSHVVGNNPIATFICMQPGRFPDAYRFDWKNRPPTELRIGSALNL